MAYIDTKYLGQCETCRHYTDSGCNTFCDCGESYSPNMFKIPTADVVEVVRCERCLHANADGTICRCGVGRAVEPNHFCSYGERRIHNG